MLHDVVAWNSITVHFREILIFVFLVIIYEHHDITDTLLIFFTRSHISIHTRRGSEREP